MSPKNDTGSSTVGTVFAILGVIALVVVASIGIWQLGWFVEEKNTEKRVEIDNEQKGTQTAWHDQAIQGIKDFELVDPSNTAARGALRNQTCQLIARLSDPYRDDIIVTFEQKECK